MCIVYTQIVLILNQAYIAAEFLYVLPYFFIHLFIYIFIYLLLYIFLGHNNYAKYERLKVIVSTMFAIHVDSFDGWVNEWMDG